MAKKDGVSENGKRVTGWSMAYREGGAGGLANYRAESIQERIDALSKDLDAWVIDGEGSADTTALRDTARKALSEARATLDNARKVFGLLPKTFTGKQRRGGRKGAGKLEAGGRAMFRENRLMIAKAMGCDTGIVDVVSVISDGAGKVVAVNFKFGDVVSAGPAGWFKPIAGESTPMNGEAKEPARQGAQDKRRSGKKAPTKDEIAEHASRLIEGYNREGLRARAKGLNIEGFGKMSKDQLAHAIATSELMPRA